jgi:hypothetical protein
VVPAFSPPAGRFPLTLSPRRNDIRIKNIISHSEILGTRPVLTGRGMRSRSFLINRQPQNVIVAGKIRKWKGKLLDVDLPKLRGQLESSRDAIFAATQIKPDLFRSN